MRKLFARVTGSVNGSKRDFEQDNQDSSSTARPSRSTSASLSLAEEGRKHDLVSGLILTAAQALQAAVQEILYDTASLQENLSGFVRLLSLLDEKRAEFRSADEYVESPLDTLLSNLKHPSFTEKCNQTGLAPALMHALRLLRMYEIKLAKSDVISSSSNHSHTKDQLVQGVTFTASKRLCLVFSTLVADHRTTEKIRSSLVKLVTFPLSALPEQGIHLQVHSATIISSLCRVGLSLQQVSFLHDLQAVTHMLRSLDALSSISEETNSIPSTDEHLLRGPYAESAGMWVVGVNCLVDILSSATSTVTVLMDEFDAAEGKRIFSQMLTGSSADHLMPLMTSMTRLLFNPKKPETVSEPLVGIIFADFLKELFNLRRVISIEDDVQSLYDISSHLVTQKVTLIGREHIIQSTGYLLLTIYSSDPSNCDLLEESYHFLSLLIVSLPALDGWDSVSAVLTTLNYVCQCIDSETEMPIVSLCAAMSVMARNALYGDTNAVRDRAFQQLDATCSSFEAIIRGQPKYASMIVKSGMLKWILCDALRGFIQVQMVPVYSRIVDFVIAVHKKGPPDVGTVQKSGLLPVLHKIFSANHVDSCPPLQLTQKLLYLLEELVRADPTHLEEVFRCIIRLLDVLIPVKSMSNSPGSRASVRAKGSGNVEKISSLCDCLCRIIEGRKKALVVWRDLQGLQWLIALLVRMEGAFTSLPGVAVTPSPYALTAGFKVKKGGISPLRASRSMSRGEGDNTQLSAPSLGSNIAALLGTMNALLNCIAVDFAVYSSPDTKTKESETSRPVMRRNYRLLADALIATNVFCSEHAEYGLRALFGLLEGEVQQLSLEALGAGSPAVSQKTQATDLAATLEGQLPYVCAISGIVIVPAAAEVILEMLLRLPPSIGVKAVKMLQIMAERAEGCQQLCDADICQLILQKFYPIISTKSEPSPHHLGMPLFGLVRVLMIGYLRAKDFSTLLYYLLRPEVIPDPTGYALLPPWQATGERRESGEIEGKRWETLDLILDIQRDSASILSQAVPYVIIGGVVKPYLTVQLSDTKIFPQSAFTFSVWARMLSGGGGGGSRVPLLSIAGLSGSFLELHWETSSRLLRVAVCKRGLVSVIHFMLPVSLNVNINAWNLVVISVHAKKQVTKGAEKSAKSAVCLFFNGLPCQPVGAHLIAIEIPTGPINLSVGRFSMDLTVAQDEGTKEDLRIVPTEQPAWALGPLILWDDSLSVTQLSLIFLRGPAYTGIFQAESPLSDYLASVSCDLLRRCDVSGIRIEEYTKELGLKGLESVVDPPVEHLSTIVSSYDLPILPPAFLAYSAETFTVTRTASSTQPRSRSQSPSNDQPAESPHTSYVCQYDLSLQSSHLHGGSHTGPAAVIKEGTRVIQPATLASCVANCGGPSVLYPMVQAADSEHQLIGSLQLIRFSVLGNNCNLKYMQIKGYKILGFLLSIKHKGLITLPLMDELFEFSVSRGSKVNQDGSRNHSLLLADTPALYYLLLNHQIWNLKRYHYTRKVIKYLEQLSSNSFHGDLNNRRLAALGVIRWCLLSAVTSALDFCSTPRGDKEKESAREMAREREMQQHGRGSSDLPDTWQLSLYTAEDMINERDRTDPYLSATCAIINRVVLSEVQKKDLEMIANVVLYTLSCKSRTVSTAKKSESRSKTDSTTQSSGRSHGLGAGVGTGVGDDDESGDTARVGPLTMLRMYLLRLLFTAYDSHITGITIRSSAFKADLKDKDKQYQGLAEKEKERERERERNESSIACSASVMAFRISFNPEWFLSVFEKCAVRSNQNQAALGNQMARGDPATHCLTLRFLALMIQSDGIFLKDFCAKDGMKYLRSLLLHHIDLADVITLLGMFFGIPMHLLPLPCQLYVVPAESSDNRKDKDKAVNSTAKKDSRAGNLTVLLTLKECQGVDLSEGGMKDFSLPLLEILLDCLPAANDKTDQSAITPGSDPNEIQSKVRDAILSTLSQAYYTLRSFRRLLQQKAALQAVVTTLIFFSDVSTVPVGVTHPPIRSDLELREDYFAIVSSSSTFSSVATTPAKGERTSPRVRTDAASSAVTTETNNSSSSSSPSGNSVADERGLFRASANWDSLFAQKATPPNPPPHPVAQPQPLPLTHTTGSNLDPEIYFTVEGKTLLQLVSSIISSAITEFENASVLCALLLSLPSGTSEESLQLLIVRCVRDVLDDIFNNFFDQNSSKKSKNILLVLSAVFNHLTPFFRSKLFTPLANFEIFKLSLSVLVRCYDLYSSDVTRPDSIDRLASLSGESTEKDIAISREKENDREKERRERSKVSALLIAKDIGRSGRYFACSCLQAVEAGEMKSARERSLPFRDVDSSIFEPTEEAPAHSSNFPSSGTYALQFVRESLSALLQPNLFTDKEDFDFSPLVVIRTTRKERDFSDEKPSSSMLSLETFRLNWTGGNEDSAAGQSRRAGNESYGMESSSTQATAVGEKQRCSEAFCMIVLKRCLYCLTAPHTGTGTAYARDDLTTECCRILTLLFIHRRCLIDQYLSSPSQPPLTQTQTQAQQIRSSKENELQYIDEDRGEGLAVEPPEELITGLSLLLPVDEDYQGYEQYLSSMAVQSSSADSFAGWGTGADEKQRAQEREREERFCSWLRTNRIQALKGLGPLITYVQSIQPSDQEVSDEAKMIRTTVSLRAGKDRSLSPSKSTLSSASGPTTSSLLFQSPGKRSDDIQKLGDLIALQARRWLVFGFLHISSGAFLWAKVWGALQAGPLWGYEPLPLPCDTNPRSLRDSEKEKEKGPNEVTLPVKRWSLAPTEGPERARIRMHQEFEPLIVVGKDGLITQIARKGDTMSSKTPQASEKGAGDMEGFLKEVTEKGFIRKTSAVVPFGDLECVMEPDRARDVLSPQGSAEEAREYDRGMSLGDMADRGDIDSEGSDSDDSNEEAEIIFSATQTGSSDSDDLKKGTQGPSSASELLSGWYFAPKDKVRQDSPQSGLHGDSEVFKRSTMLVELVKGAVGGTDWHQGKKYNVQRISGLESQSALIVLTRTNLHILTGFRVKHIGAASATGGYGSAKAGEGRVVVEWVASMESAATARNQVLAGSTPNTNVGGNGSSSNNNNNSSSSSSSSSSFSYSGSFDRSTKSLPTVKESSPIKKTALAAAEAAYAAAAVGLTGSTGQPIGEVEWLADIWKEVLSFEDGYRCFPLDEVHSVFKRRHQLKYTALRITDTSGSTLLFSCDSEAKCDEVLLRLFEADLPASLFHQVIGIKNLQLLRGLSNMYNRLMALFLSSATSKWLKGEVSNFDYLMHVNVAAGRSFQDLTQYPVFPWILADYTSEVLDLNDPKSYRDLSKPMGALGLKRAKQYRDRYRTMDDFKRNGIEGTPPPFYYGTHYSCAGYVLHYLLRLQPFSNMAVALQGGHFDKPDRLFMSIEQSWLSASSMNLQDVRELIPEFFCLPDFLMNKNNFDFGITQKGEEVCDVQLPVWALGDSSEFIRKNREALESKFVSENLHEWIDLIFGYKQRGLAAEEAMNVFIHLTYDGEVDVDAITDPILRDATIAQINNFGQTPTKLFDKPHPKKTVPDLLRRTPTDLIAVDSLALQWHEQSVLTPPLCMAGAPQLTTHTRMSYNLAAYPAVCGNRGPCAVGDIMLFAKDKLLSLPTRCHFLSPATGSKKIVQYGGSAGGISIHSVTASTGRNGAVDDREGTYHERLHDAAVTCVSAGRVGTKDILATGSKDSTIRLWSTLRLADKHRIEHLHTLSGHTGAVLCIDLSAQYHVLLSGSADCTAALWDVRAGKLLRVLGKHEGPVISVSVNSLSGHTLTLSCAELRMYSINGDVLGKARMGSDPTRYPPFPPSLFVTPDKMRDVSDSPPRRKVPGRDASHLTPASGGRVVLAPPCAGWQDGVVAVTGHDNGQVIFWRLQAVPGVESSRRQLVAVPLALTAAQSAAQTPSQFQTQVQTQKRVQTHPHTHHAPITVLRLCPITSSRPKDLYEKGTSGGPMDLLVGDEKGFVSSWTVLKLDHLSPAEIGQIATLKPPPSREVQSSGSAVGGTLSGAANAFAPLGASGLMKLLGGAGLGSGGHSHAHSSHTSHHEPASVLAARIQEIEDLSNDDHMEEFF